MTTSHKRASFHWDDPFLLDEQLTDDERMVRDAASAYCQDRLAPRVLEAFRNQHHRPRDLPRDGRARPARPDHSRAVRRPGPQLRLLRPDRARGRARRLGLPLDDERAVLAGHGADQRVRHRGAEAEVPAQAGHRRMDRLLRPDRARPRLRPRQHGHARAQGARRLQPHAAPRCGSATAPIADVFVVWAKDDEGTDPRLRAREGRRRACRRRPSTARSACAPASPARS